MTGYNKEYANEKISTYSDYTLSNNVARYRCNNIIGTDNDTDATKTSITNAKETYETLYSIYNKNANNLDDKVKDNMFGGDPAPHCIGGSGTNINKCPHAESFFQSLTSNQSPNVLAYSDIDGKGVRINDLKVYLDDCGARIRDYDNAHLVDGTASYAKVKNEATNFRDVSYNSLVRTRSDLDNKMNEILGNNKNSILYEKQSELDASVYSTLLWTVMVTSLIYYVFTKI